MDPNATLKEIRALLAKIATLPDEAEFLPAKELAERVEALDGWLSRGGFSPSAWSQGRR